MIRLIKNEFYKLFHKMSTYIFLLIAVIIVVITNIIYNHYEEPENSFSTYIDINEINDFINNYDPTSDSVYDYAYNLALLDSYSLSHSYNTDSWQYYVFMNDYLITNQEYYEELYSSNPDEELLEQLDEQLANMLQAIYTDSWQYFAKMEIIDLENSILEYENILENSELSTQDKNEFNKQLFIAKETLELVNYRLENDVSYGNDYLNDAIDNIMYVLPELANYYYEEDINSDDYQEVIKEYYENKYILEEKIDTNNNSTLRMVLINFFSEYSFLIIIFIVSIAGGIVSDEFSKGTIKSLLIIPHNRATILWAKYITILICIPLIFIFLLLSELIVGGFILGFDSLSIPVVIYNTSLNSLEIFNVFSYALINLLANLPQIILLATLSFALSTIINNTGAAITLSFCGMIAAEIINSFAYAYDVKILDYFITTNWDFTYYLFGGSSPFGLTLGFSSMICLTYLIILILITFIVFINKDIKNT